GDIIIYNIETYEIYEIGRIMTGLTNEVMSVKVAPDNSIWYVCTNLNELHQIVGLLMGDINSDNLLSLSDILLLINHLVGNYVIEQENQNSADINFDGVIDIFDLLHVCDLIHG
nr:dockerin type I domain-containing protein [Gammaproteobacteria bacterium]